MIVLNNDSDVSVTKREKSLGRNLRIKGILRRTYRITENKMIRLGSTEVDLLSGIVINRDKKYVLTAKEYALFSKLYDNLYLRPFKEIRFEGYLFHNLISIV